MPRHQPTIYIPSSSLETRVRMFVHAFQVFLFFFFKNERICHEYVHWFLQKAHILFYFILFYFIFVSNAYYMFFFWYLGSKNACTMSILNIQVRVVKIRRTLSKELANLQSRSTLETVRRGSTDDRL